MFKLSFEITPSNTKITLNDKVYLIGSCFSDEIGNKLATFKFNSLHNPFGTLYNPISIFKALGETLNPTNTVESQGIYYHWDCHGEISALNQEGLEEKVRSTSKTSMDFISDSTVLIITLGTSFAYRHKEDQKLVANCHKIPAENFEKLLLNKEEILSAFSKLYASLKSNLTIIFTVSPVRHLRDGLVENNLSKAILIEAVHELVGQYENVQYFPAYEIVHDELRDYRFFAKDMAHPSKQAIDYIWERFSDVYFDSETNKFIVKWKKIRTAMDHKAFQPESNSHQDFLKRTISDLSNLKSLVDVSKEMKILEDQLL